MSDPQLIADLSTLQSPPSLAAIDRQTAVGNEVNTLSIIGTTSVVPITADAQASEIEDAEPIADVAVTEVTQGDRFATSADEAEVASPRDVPRLRVDLLPLTHPLASTEPKRTSPHAKDSSAAAEALFGIKSIGPTQWYDASAMPSLIAIRDVPSTKPAADASSAENEATAKDAAQLVESKRAPSPVVKSSPRVVVPIARAPVAQAPVAQVPVARAPVAQTPVLQTSAPQQGDVLPVPAPPQTVAQRVAPNQQKPNQENQLAHSDDNARNHSTPKAIATPVVAPRGNSTATLTRTIPLQRGPVQAGRPTARPPVSREMLAVRKMADGHTFAGFDFASRRALYSAEAEFISSLRVLTRALDRRDGNKEHAAALAEGITALEESVDFLASGSELEADFDVSMIVAGHRTSVLRGGDGLREMTPLDAVQHYYAFAQQRLADAVAGEPSGSFALYGLGKMHAALAVEPGANPEALEPKAMVFHQAALKASPTNYMAANELAVLLARYGQLDEARNLLRHSISIDPQPSTWHNLAMVHAQLGEQQLAEAASAEHTFAQKRPVGNPNETTVSPVLWLEPNDFSRTSDQARTPAASDSTMPSTTSAPVHQTAASKQSDGGVFGMFKRK
jgi:tetratricopeptide (TPR) repeat protein